MKNLMFIKTIGACVALSAVMAHTFAAQPQAEPTPNQRLSDEIARMIHHIMSNKTLTVDLIEGSTLVVQEAAAIDPDNVDNWRLMLELGILAEREDMVSKASENILRLDPDDEPVRLMRLNLAIEKYQTADERVAAYERLLSADHIDKLGGPVASRLAFDLALLQRRMGNTKGFTDALSRSLALDSSNHAAAALAAGYFRANLKDPFAEAELLVNVVLSNPTDIRTQVELARLLLENGAYRSARRLYDLAVTSTIKSGEIPDTDLLIDQAIAHWAQGDANDALEIVNKRSVEIDEAMREQLRQRAGEASIPIKELTALKAPKDPGLASAQAVIATAAKPQEAPGIASAAIEAYTTRLSAMAAAASQPSAATPQPAESMPAASSTDIARLNLDAAWMAVWLGSNIDQVDKFLEQADRIEPLSQNAKDRFQGWLAFRGGDSAKAIEILSPLAQNDAAARLGLALALQAQDKRREAATELLAVAREQPGSLMGIWAANRLMEMVGQRTSLSNLAKQLDDLIDTIPQSLNRGPELSSMGLNLRLTSEKTVYYPFDPLPVRLEITNNSALPMSIDREGPITPQVLVIVALNSANLPGLKGLAPIVVDIGRRLRLEPHQTLVVPIDFRRYMVGTILNAIVRNGSMMSVRGYLNFHATSIGALRPSLYGSEASAPLMRVEGAKVNEEWLKNALAVLAAPEFPSRSGTLVMMALLQHRIGTRSKLDATDEEKQLVEQAAAVFPEAFAKLDPVSQAWLVCIMPENEKYQTILDVVRRTEHRQVKVAYLLSHASASDPMIDAVIQGDDPALRKLAEFTKNMGAEARGSGTGEAGAATETPAPPPATAPAATDWPGNSSLPKPAETQPR